jgi:TonB family protein
VTTAPKRQPIPFGKYLLLDRVNIGGMAEVWRAKTFGAGGFERIVAIKRILPNIAEDEEFISMFLDEAKITVQLNHANIAQIYELNNLSNSYFIAMEYVSGKDLRAVFDRCRKRGEPAPIPLTCYAIAQCSEGLDYAHRAKDRQGRDMSIVHRDVSPQNILISDEGDIKLCDFGIAKAASKVSTTMSGALKGKLQYMSPEQAWGKRLDRRSDIFSLGSVLYEMLTGAPLFEGDTDMSVLESVREGDVATPSARGAEVPKRVDQIVVKALAKNPQDRYQNASEFEKDLHAVLYTYQPSPGPADLAIYMHRLLEAPPASDDEIDAAFDKARDMSPGRPGPVSVPAAPPKRGKGLVIVQTGEIPRPVLPAPAPASAPAPEPRPEPVARRAVGESAAALPAAGESRKSRTGLIAGISFAAAVLVAGGLFVTRGRFWGVAPAAASAPKVEPAAAATSSAAPAVPPQPAATAPLEPAKIIDPKAVEAEAKRLAAEREKALRAAKQSGTAGKPATATAPPPAAIGLAPVKAAEPPRAAEIPTPAAAAAKAPDATGVPVIRAPEVKDVKAAEPVAEVPKPAAAPPAEVSAPEKPPAIPAPSSAPVKEGDLVGPGEGVVEPRIVRLGAMSALPAQSRQIARGADGSIGTPFVMALIDERGAVLDVRIIRPSNYKFVDEAAVRALKGATIQPATKDGVKVRMWKTFPITVKP